MKKNLFITLVSAAVLVAGCTEDKSAETRQVSKPNPPITSTTPPAGTPGATNVPDRAKDMLKSVAPGAGGN